MIFYPINRTDIYNAGVRFDAGYHLSEGMSTRRTLTCAPMGTIPIADASKRIFYGVRANRIYVSNRSYAIPFLTGSSIMLSDFSNTKLVSQKLTPAITEMTLKEGWIMITRSGTVGLTAWSNKLHAGKYGSEDIIRIIPNNRIKGGVIYSYLASRYGQSLLTQGAFGAVVQHIEPDFVGSLPIPIFPEDFQKTVDNLIQESATLREEAYEALTNALSIFEANIGVSESYGEYEHGCVNIQKVTDKFTRFDAQYQLGKQKLSKEKDILTTIKIGNVAKRIFIGNRDKRNYVEKGGVTFLSSSDMMLADPRRGAKMISRKTSNIEEMLVNQGDLLISRSGTVGNTVIVGEYLDQCAVSEHAMRLVLDNEKIAPEYVYAYLRTRQGQNSLKVLPYGSVIITLGEELLADVDLPLLDEHLQTEIVTLIKTYVKKNDKAVKKENLAIQMVEQEIEKWNR